MLRICPAPSPPAFLRQLFALGGLLISLGGGSVLLAASPTPEQLQFFEAKVRPILVQNCQKCHGAEKQKGDLRLDLKAGIMAGGESGAAVVPGKPEESLLVEAINYDSFEMPPDGKLPAADIATLVEWVKIGAPWPEEHGGNGPALRQGRDKITAADRQYWAFQPLHLGALPTVESDTWSRGPIDRFLLAAMRAEGVQPAPPASRQTLIRRVYFDLIGLPPTPEETIAFLADNRPDAYERLVDRLLASPQYGERWSRHWLDLVRYAESDGYRQDAFRPNAWRYRDYVIRAFNADKPYDRFVQEQIAGDEIAPHDPDALIATGYLRLGIYEYNQRDVETQWRSILNDVTDVTADVFLGMGMSCARCHDHKFDPILQKDYFRLQAFFTPVRLLDDTPVVTPEVMAEYQQKLADWEAKTADIRRQLSELEQPVLDSLTRAALNLFPNEVLPGLYKAEADRTPYEQQIYELCYRQAKESHRRVDFAKKLKGEAKEKWEALQKQLAEFNDLKPAPLPTARTVSDVGAKSAPTLIPGKRNAEPIEPGILTVLDPNPMTIPTPSLSTTTGRRAALAEWLTRADNPLTPRVMANRVWQYHFGRGLAESPSDFGRLGQPPSHPELLDYLAGEFIASGWSIKHLHREMLTSAAYQQASRGVEIAETVQKDPSNRLFARNTVRRLQAELVRDSILCVTGKLNPKMSGPGVEPTNSRRTIYVKVIRNKRDPLLDVFDMPDGQSSMPQRNNTTTALQSLLMMNGPSVFEHARTLAFAIQDDQPANDRERVQAAYRRILGREPSSEEIAAAVQFLAEQRKESKLPLSDLCHMLLNSNEFIYVD